jgi:putative ABC transport system ATP-binding protein
MESTSAPLSSISKQIITNQPPKPTTPNAILWTTQLCKQVGQGEQQIQILHNLDLSVTKGERLAIVGSSGSGKSTLLGILAGLDTPTTGTVWVDGVAFSQLDEDGRAAMRGKHMGFVFQSFQLLPAMTALENVMIPMQLNGIQDPKNRALETLANVGLSERLHHYPKQLSGGEQQRVAIARAFAMQPDILFADEPTGNLDSATGEHIIESLFRLNQAHQTTLILVTHDMQLAKRCDRMLTLRDGALHAK